VNTVRGGATNASTVLPFSRSNLRRRDETSAGLDGAILLGRIYRFTAQRAVDEHRTDDLRHFREEASQAGRKSMKRNSGRSDHHVPPAASNFRSSLSRNTFHACAAYDTAISIDGPYIFLPRTAQHIKMFTITGSIY